MRRVLGTDHDVTLLVTAVIATAAVESGNAVDGGRLAREVLATIGDAGGSKQPIRLLATAALAHAAESQGRYPEAAQAYGKLVELDQGGIRLSRAAWMVPDVSAHHDGLNLERTGGVGSCVGC